MPATQYKIFISSVQKELAAERRAVKDFIGLKRMDVRELRRYRQFYLVYPQIRETLLPEFRAT